MSVMETLGQTGAIQSMARELGVSETQAASGAAALIPAILGGFKKHAQAQPTWLRCSISTEMATHWTTSSTWPGN